MRRRRRGAAAVPEATRTDADPFPPAFQQLLADVLRAAPRLRTTPESDVRARRRLQAASGTFAGHRAYSVGDDLRNVDWNVYARSGELFLKVLEDDDRRTVTLLLDSSASMLAGEPPRWPGAQRLAAILGGLALVHLDGLRLLFGSGRVASLHGAAALPRLLDLVRQEAALGADPDGAAALALVRTPLERGWAGKCVWISDFAEPRLAEPVLRLLRRHGRACTGLLPGVADDEGPPHAGWLRVVDPETGREERLAVDAALAAAMREELRQLARHQEAVFAACGYPLVRFPLPATDDFRLRSWLRGAWTLRL